MIRVIVMIYVGGVTQQIFTLLDSSLVLILMIQERFHAVDNCDGIERIPIMRLALEEINGRCDLLPGYRLVVDYANSAVS